MGTDPGSLTEWRVQRHRYAVKPRIVFNRYRWECKARGYRTGWAFTPRVAFLWWVKHNNPRLRSA